MVTLMGKLDNVLEKVEGQIRLFSEGIKDRHHTSPVHTSRTLASLLAHANDNNLCWGIVHMCNDLDRL